MPIVHYLRHHTRAIQSSLAADLLVYLINLASVRKVCYRLSAVQYFGTNITWRWYRSQLEHKLVYHVLITQKIINERDSNGIMVNQGFEKIRAWFKSWKGKRHTHTHLHTHQHTLTHTNTHTHTHTHTQHTHSHTNTHTHTPTHTHTHNHTPTHTHTHTNTLRSKLLRINLIDAGFN